MGVEGVEEGDGVVVLEGSRSVSGTLTLGGDGLQVEEMVARSGGIAMRGREFETTLGENLVLESRVWVFGEEKRRGESV